MMALFSMIVAFLGFIPPLGFIALLMGVLATRKIKQENLSGGGMALTAIIFGCLATLLYVLSIFPIIKVYESIQFDNSKAQIERLYSAVEPYESDHMDSNKTATLEVLKEGSYLSDPDLMSPAAEPEEALPHYGIVPYGMHELDGIRVYETAPRYDGKRMVVYDGDYYAALIEESEWQNYKEFLTADYHLTEAGKKLKEILT